MKYFQFHAIKLLPEKDQCGQDGMMIRGSYLNLQNGSYHVMLHISVNGSNLETLYHQFEIEASSDEILDTVKAHAYEMASKATSIQIKTEEKYYAHLEEMPTHLTTTQMGHCSEYLVYQFYPDEGLLGENDIVVTFYLTGKHGSAENEGKLFCECWLAKSEDPCSIHAMATYIDTQQIIDQLGDIVVDCENQLSGYGEDIDRLNAIYASYLK